MSLAGLVVVGLVAVAVVDRSGPIEAATDHEGWLDPDAPHVFDQGRTAGDVPYRGHAQIVEDEVCVGLISGAEGQAQSRASICDTPHDRSDSRPMTLLGHGGPAINVPDATVFAAWHPDEDVVAATWEVDGSSVVAEASPLPDGPGRVVVLAVDGTPEDDTVVTFEDEAEQVVDDLVLLGWPGA